MTKSGRRLEGWFTPGRWVVLATTANVVSTGIFLFASAHADEAARRHNCAQVAEAFEGYTDALAEVSHADATTVAVFRSKYEPIVNTCR